MVSLGGRNLGTTLPAWFWLRQGLPVQSGGPRLKASISLPPPPPHAPPPLLGWQLGTTTLSFYPFVFVELCAKCLYDLLKKNKWLRRDLRILILSSKRHHCQRALVLEVGFCVFGFVFSRPDFETQSVIITFVVFAKFLNLASLSFSIKVIDVTKATLCGPSAV